MVLWTIWDWITGVPATIWGSLVAGIMTLAGVVIGQFAIYRREQEKEDRELEALRDALAVELQTMDAVLERLLYIAHDMDKAREQAYSLTGEQYEKSFKNDYQAQLSLLLVSVNEVPDGIDVYEANADKIGKLDSNEAESVIQTHKVLQKLHQRLQTLSMALDQEDLVLNDEIDWSSKAGLGAEVVTEKALIETEVVNALLLQKMTLAHLGHNPSDHDRALAAYALTRDEPKSRGHDRAQQYIEKHIEDTDISFEDLSN